MGKVIWLNVKILGEKPIGKDGISIEIHQINDEQKNVSINMNNYHYGSHGIDFDLRSWGEGLDAQFLKEIGNMFIKAAIKVEEQES